MEQYVTDKLLSIADTADNVAMQYKAAKYAMIEQDADGFACLFRTEARERWMLSGEIRSYVQKHKGKILKIGQSGIIQIPSGSVSSCLASLVGFDEKIIATAKQACKVIMSSGDLTEAVFLTGIIETLQEDRNEVAKVLDHSKDDVPSKLVVMNETLRQKYGKEYR